MMLSIMPGTIQQIAEGFHFIQRGWLNGNHFVIAGEKPTLIDTAYLGGLDDTLALIRACGADPARVGLIVNTHAHCDHIGGNRAIQDLSGCRVALHAVERHFVDQWNGWALWWRYYSQDARPFATHQSLRDGDQLTLGGMTWLVIHTPGHGMGQVALFQPDTGWLISADNVWDHDFGVLTPRIEGLDCGLRLQESLARLARLPVSTVYPGHGAPLADGRAAIEACRARIAAFLEEPARMGRDQARKIFLYTVMMRGPLDRGLFKQKIEQAPWWGECCDLYFEGARETIFEQTLDELLAKGLLSEGPRGLVCALPA